MIENYIVSYVIMPHGITDLTRVKVNELPLLFLIYILSLGTCVFIHEILHYGHIILFLVSSIVHFTQDFLYLKYPLIPSIFFGSNVVMIPMILFYYQKIWFAKIFMIMYMVLFHVPLHYHRIKIKRKDIIFILLSMFVFGIMGPMRLKEIEDSGVKGVNSIMVCGLVVGHVGWNL